MGYIGVATNPALSVAQCAFKKIKKRKEKKSIPKIWCIIRADTNVFIRLSCVPPKALSFTAFMTYGIIRC